jgi:hypothetical protein
MSRMSKIGDLGVLAALAALATGACGKLKPLTKDAGPAVDAPSADVPATDAPATREAAAPDARPEDDAADATPDADLTTPLGFCEAYYRALDARLTQCQGRAQSANGNCTTLTSAVSKGRVAFHPEKAAACVRGLETSSCLGLESVQFYDNYFTAPSYPACDALTPLVQPGQDCDLLPYLNECVGAAACVSNVTCGGQCAAVKPAGSSCYSAGPCPPGTGCSGADPQCNPLVGEGEFCAFRHTPCALGLYCDRKGGIEGYCRARHATGACSNDDECTPPASCIGPVNSQSCVTLKPLGAPCTPGQYECGGDTWCGANDLCTNVGAKVGQLCGPQGPGAPPDETPCPAGTFCENYICVPPPKPGEPCDNDVECGDHVTGYCDVEATSQVCVSCPP